MGSVGDSYDNALMENFFSTLKIELVYRKSWRTRDEAENALFAYIETSHQPKLSSRGWSIGRGRTGAEGLVGVVGLTGGQAAVQLAEHAVE
jgi:hypothetical protein